MFFYMYKPTLEIYTPTLLHARLLHASYSALTRLLHASYIDIYPLLKYIHLLLACVQKFNEKEKRGERDTALD